MADHSYLNSQAHVTETLRHSSTTHAVLHHCSGLSVSFRYVWSFTEAAVQHFRSSDNHLKRTFMQKPNSPIQTFYNFFPNTQLGIQFTYERHSGGSISLRSGQCEFAKSNDVRKTFTQPSNNIVVRTKFDVRRICIWRQRN